MVTTHVLWLFTILVTCHCANVQIYPDIPEEDGLHLVPGSQVTLSCRSTEKISWIHNSFLSEELTPKYDLYVEGEEHVSNLTISKVSYRHVGSYMCQSTTHNKTIYIYVTDKTHLLFKPSSFDLFAALNADVIIPCKPTHTAVDVCLYDSDYNKFTDYDPKLGFKVKDVTLMNSGYFVCEANTTFIEKHTFHLSPAEPDLPVPVITSDGEDSEDTILDVMVGGTLNMMCSVELRDIEKIQKLHWEMWPAQKSGMNDTRVQMISEDKEIDEDNREVMTQLIIHNVTYQDSGNYTCTLLGVLEGSQTQKHQAVHVLGVNESYLDVSTDSKLEVLRPEGFEKVEWSVIWKSSAKPTFSWFSPQGLEITDDPEMERYEVTIEKMKTMLTVHDLMLKDAGRYTLVATIPGIRKEMNFTLLVESGAQVTLEPLGIYYKAGETYNFHCNVMGYPLPNVTWLFQKCDQYPKCDIDFVEISRDQYEHSVFNSSEVVSTEIRSKFTWIANNPGMLMCRACNSVSYQKKHICNNATIDLLVTDLKDGYSISGPSETYEKDDVTLVCGANKYHYATNISMKYQSVMENGNIIVNEIVNNPNQGIYLNTVATKYSNTVHMKLSSVHVNQSGNYSCEASRVGPGGEIKGTEVVWYSMNVQVLVVPKFKPGSTKNGLPIYSKTGEEVVLRCSVLGTPPPTIIWYKDDKPLRLNPANPSRGELKEGNQTLKIASSALTDEGSYKCVATNKVGSIHSVWTVELQDKFVPAGNFLVVVVLLVVLLILCLLFIYKIRKTTKSYKRKLNIWREGAVPSLNPELGVSEQADLLPYNNKKWEFPRKKLTLGQQLGSGAFGVVMRADADGIIEPGKITEVAVKMIKKTNVDPNYLKALASELKIMSNLGKHLNIVNLLGACTENFDKRELLVIVEYCKYGNLHSFLLKHREIFIDQVDSLGNVDPTITTRKPRYVNIPFPLVSPNSTSVTGSKTYMSSRTASTGISDSSPDTAGMIGSDGYLIPNDKEPAWRSNYVGSDRNSGYDSITTQDLICWAFQVCQGMEYLASRKVMHGDLAARNILLAEEKIVKICDFGLAKNMYQDTNYQKKGDEPLPIKWMAMESISDRIFSTQSDVWAFGVTLWEMFSLSRTPYPGIEGVQNIYTKLAGGYRMEKPDYSPDDIYTIMLECWDAKPVLRPNFTELTERIGAMVEDPIRKHYLNLNEVYLRLNAEDMQGEDYLAMLSSPDIRNMVTSASDEGDDGYLEPTDVKEETAMEMKPMLPQIADSVLESKASSFSNPSYLEFTNNTHPESSPFIHPRGKLNSVDDYENVPYSKRDMTRAMKLNWLFPPDLKQPDTTFV